MKAVNFTILSLKSFWKTITLKCIQHTMKENFVAERFIKTLRNTIQKHMTAVFKNVYFDVLGHIVDNYNNTFSELLKWSL